MIVWNLVRILCPTKLLFLLLLFILNQYMNPIELMVLLLACQNHLLFLISWLLVDLSYDFIFLTKGKKLEITDCELLEVKTLELFLTGPSGKFIRPFSRTVCPFDVLLHLLYLLKRI